MQRRSRSTNPRLFRRPRVNRLLLARSKRLTHRPTHRAISSRLVRPADRDKPVPRWRANQPGYTLARNKVLATASKAGVMLFDLATGRRLLRIADSGVPNGFGENTSMVAFSPDGKKLLGVFAPGAIPMAVTGAIATFDSATGKKLATFKAP